MRKYIPIVISLLIVGIFAYVIISKKENKQIKKVENIGNFTIQKSCATSPQFLKSLNIPEPVIIDLSQKRFTGLTLRYGKGFSQIIHPKEWEKFEHFGTYISDNIGNIFLVPMPFISIEPTTFNLQKNLYRVDSVSGKLSIFMHFDDVIPSPRNPYGLNAIALDCDDQTFWVASIDQSSYTQEKGRIYHINPILKEVMTKIDNIDVLSMKVVKSDIGKYLLIGSARDNGLYAYTLNQKKIEIKKLFTLPSPNLRIRKIKIKSNNHLELQAIPFSYTLITQTSKKDRVYYDAEWKSSLQKWLITQK